MTHPYDPDSSIYEAMREAGRGPRTIPVRLTCSRCQRPVSMTIEGRCLDCTDELRAVKGVSAFLTPQEEQHLRTTLLQRTADMLDEALHGRARFDVREAAYDAMAQARRRCSEVDGLIFGRLP